ncbi:hypothetical protein [Xanthomonas floridensis]|uniref:Uncharacterized protein n=1 Tax=Xanthomonas floridensis TaxID=1843580 RepID=A0A1A9M9A6_9XANT|nr:hypothetical protein [Xanthomonas floridensis]MEA5123232.1 hypothetical protein [Xanthomonas floridensis]MEA5130742.1 hypothetical protein [Xanthomonas floridensis]OAG66875.1 hypothetical protein A7D17_03910 [Xanthomonas floridensis]
MRLPLAIVIALTGTAHAAESAPVTATLAITTKVPRIAELSHPAIDSLCRAGSHLTWRWERGVLAKAEVRGP